MYLLMLTHVSKMGSQCYIQGPLFSLWVSQVSAHGPLTRYVTLRVAHAPGMPGTFPRHRLQMKPLISDPGMHHGTCVTHVPWCMSGSQIRGGGENVPGIPGACATLNFMYLARGPWVKTLHMLLLLSLVKTLLYYNNAIYITEIIWM